MWLSSRSTGSEQFTVIRRETTEGGALLTPNPKSQLPNPKKKVPSDPLSSRAPHRHARLKLGKQNHRALRSPLPASPVKENRFNASKLACKWCCSEPPSRPAFHSLTTFACCQANATRSLFLA